MNSHSTTSSSVKRADLTPQERRRRQLLDKLRCEKKRVADPEAYLQARREKQRRYAARNPEKVAAFKRRWAQANPDRVLASWHRYRDRHLSINTARHSPDAVMRAANSAIPRSIPQFIRDDVASSIILAVLEGELLFDQIGQRAKEYLSRYNRQFDSFKTASLDSLIPGTKIARIDTITADDLPW